MWPAGLEHGYLALGMYHDASVVMLYKGEALVRGKDVALGLEEISRAHGIFCKLATKAEVSQSFEQLTRLTRQATGIW